MPSRKPDDRNGDLQGKERAESPPVVRVEGGSLPTYYANNIATSLSIWDVRLEFGSIQDIKDGTMEVQPLVRVTLSPQHMKAVAALMGRLVKQYENTYGAIALPDGIVSDSSGGDADA